MPNTYDAIQIGERITWTRMVSAEDVRAFASISGDDNPLHLDEAYAQERGFERPIAHGTLILGLASKIMGRDFPGPGSLAVSLSAKFLRPVLIDSEVTLEAVVTRKLERFRRIKLRIYAYAEGKVVMSGEAIVLPPTEQAETREPGGST